MRECYNCGSYDVYRRRLRQDIRYANGQVDSTYDEYCLDCGTLLKGRIKTVKKKDLELQAFKWKW